jgi:putative flippase GtrA
MSTGERFLRFNGVGMLGIAVQLLTVSALLRWTGLNETVATALAVSAAVLHNFVWHHSWTWADRRQDRHPVLTLWRFVLANGVISLIGNVAVVWFLTSFTPLGGVVANVVGIAVCGLINFGVSDRVVFRTHSWHRGI